MSAPEYVRLTFKPAGASCSKTVWAEVISRKPDMNVYYEVSTEGDNTFSGGTSADGKTIERKKMIIAGPKSVTEKPARMSNHYGELVVIGSADDIRARKFEEGK